MQRNRHGKRRGILNADEKSSSRSTTSCGGPTSGCVRGGRVGFWHVGVAGVLGLVGSVGAFAQPVADAAKFADWETVRALVARGTDVTATQGDGTTALMLAALGGESHQTPPLHHQNVA